MCMCEYEYHSHAYICSSHTNNPDVLSVCVRVRVNPREIFTYAFGHMSENKHCCRKEKKTQNEGMKETNN